MTESDNHHAIKLLEQISSGNESALEEFYQLFENSVYRYAFSRLNDSFDAADTLNEVMLEVWKCAGRFEGRSKVSTWLLGITHHKVYDRLRKRGNRIMTEIDTNIPDEAETQDISITNAQNAELVQQCLQNLSGEHQEVIQLAFYEDMHYSQIAKIMDCPEGTVKSRVYHAKNALKRCLSNIINN